MKKVGISYEKGLLAAFLAGTVAGTILVNMMSSEMRSGLSAFPFSAGGAMVEAAKGVNEAGSKLGAREQLPLFFHLFRSRSLAAAVGWLVGLTPYGAACFFLAAGYGGLTLGVSQAVFTWQKGLAGPGYFLLTLMPHCLFYGIIWAALAVWAGKQTPRLRLFPFLCLLAVCGIGAAAECWIFPVVWRLGTGILSRTSY